MYKFLIPTLVLLSTVLQAQDTVNVVKKDSTLIQIKPIKWDTNMYRKFDYVFIVGVFSQYRDFNNEIEQHINADTSGLSKHTYVAESNVATGLVFNYDKFQLSFGTRSKPRDNSEGKGYTKMFNIGFNFGDNRWVSENYYRRFTGFYNQNTRSIDTTKKPVERYYVQPGMRNSLFMSRLMYFTNYENFSFKSGFGCNYRQLKSAATWILGASYSTYNMYNDSSLLPIKAQPLYNDYGNLHGLKSYNLGIAGGAAGTLVLFKAWFISGYFTVGPEQQWRDYNLGVAHRNLSYISVSGTFRLSMGLNLKKFYFLYSLTNDYNWFDSRGILSFRSSSVTNNVTFGWRFHTGDPPNVYKKFQKSKLYKLFG